MLMLIISVVDIPIKIHLLHISTDSHAEDVT